MKWVCHHQSAWISCVTLSLEKGGKNTVGCLYDFCESALAKRTFMHTLSVGRMSTHSPKRWFYFQKGLSSPNVTSSVVAASVFATARHLHAVSGAVSRDITSNVKVLNEVSIFMSGYFSELCYDSSYLPYKRAKSRKDRFSSYEKQVRFGEIQVCGL